jgi:hypothetical protein
MKTLATNLRATTSKDHRERSINALEKYIDDTKFILEAPPETSSNLKSK